MRSDDSADVGNKLRGQRDLLQDALRDRRPQPFLELPSRRTVTSLGLWNADVVQQRRGLDDDGRPAFLLADGVRVLADLQGMIDAPPVVSEHLPQRLHQTVPNRNHHVRVCRQPPKALRRGRTPRRTPKVNPRIPDVRAALAAIQKRLVLPELYLTTTFRTGTDENVLRLPEPSVLARATQFRHVNSPAAERRELLRRSILFSWGRKQAFGPEA